MLEMIAGYILRHRQRLMCLNGSNVKGTILEGTHLLCVNKSLDYPNTYTTRDLLCSGASVEAADVVCLCATKHRKVW